MFDDGTLTLRSRLSMGLACLVACLLLLGVASPAVGQDEHPIQLSLLNPVQIFHEDDAIRGVRLSLLYGKNTNVSGLDVGLVSHSTRDFRGVQFGAVGYSEGDFSGWQSTAVNIVEGSFVGLQDGIFSSAENGRGVQFSGVNRAGNFRGLQIAVVNYARRLNGVQIGLVNIIREDGMFPVFPIVNWGR